MEFAHFSNAHVLKSADALERVDCIDDTLNSLAVAAACRRVVVCQPRVVHLDKDGAECFAALLFKFERCAPRRN